VDISANHAPPHRTIGHYVRDEPLTALAIAAAAGFVLGGGVNRRLGLAMLTIVGRVALRNVAASVITGVITNTNAKPTTDE
jgi:hypothetical protein